MRIEFYKSLWGWESRPVLEACEDALARGYDGIETPIATILAARGAGYEGKAISMLFPTSLDELRDGLHQSKSASVDKVTVHAGHDWWPNDRASGFFENALPLVEKSGLEVNFETHRGRLLFSPASTFYFLQEFPKLHICADFSHWTTVCESMLLDQARSVNTAIAKTRHLHARIGHEEGPQVPDPRGIQWEGHLRRFLELWDAIKLHHEAVGAEVMTVDPEFGPPNYLWTDPANARPLADQHEICDWVMAELKQRWG